MARCRAVCVIVPDRHHHQARHIALFLPLGEIVPEYLHARHIGEETVVLAEVVTGTRFENRVFHVANLNPALRRIVEIQGGKAIVEERQMGLTGAIPEMSAGRRAQALGTGWRFPVKASGVSDVYGRDTGIRGRRTAQWLPGPWDMAGFDFRVLAGKRGTLDCNAPVKIGAIPNGAISSLPVIPK